MCQIPSATSVFGTPPIYEHSDIHMEIVRWLTRDCAMGSTSEAHGYGYQEVGWEDVDVMMDEMFGFPVLYI